MRNDLFSGRATRAGETQKERAQSVGQAMTRSRGMTYFRAGQPESCSRRRRRQCALHSAVVVASLSSVHASAYASCNTRVLQPTTGTTMWQQPQQRAQPCGNSHHNRNHHVAAATTAGTTMWQQPRQQTCGPGTDLAEFVQRRHKETNWPANQGPRLVSRRLKQQRRGCAHRCGRGCARPARTVSLLTA